ncbi:chloride channel protein ClC-Kb-like [Convolutriloba macropyga]|uniref:chloride channel protein ClC-Kb-like n=1 Tax=Convolutriloba macropyga TaxID=536237 RepID=UPI003F51B16C
MSTVTYSHKNDTTSSQNPQSNGSTIQSKTDSQDNELVNDNDAGRRRRGVGGEVPAANGVGGRDRRFPVPAPNHSQEELEYASTVMFGSHTQKELQNELGSRGNLERRSQKFQSMRKGDKRLKSVATEGTGDSQIPIGLDPNFSPDEKSSSRLWRCLTCYTCPKARDCLQLFGSKIGEGFGEEWLFLLLLGIIMACLSYIMDYAILKFQEAHIIVYYEVKGSVGAQYAVWVLYPLIFITFATGFVHLVEPNAVGSGIPEMKTIIRGVTLHEYLSFRTLISKTIGLTISLGSGMPIGKEGPFVHVASMVATQLSTVVTSFQGFYRNPTRNTEMLAAACAVGVACNFAAPIGGVLFSIEVTATYFAVRNYWRGFFSAVIGALVFQLIGMFADNEKTITALFSTNFPVEIPFDPLELFIFAFIGVICGFAGAFYVFFHRHIVLFIRKPFIHKLLSTNRFIYPTIVVLIIASLTFPPGFGQYMAADLTSKEQINSLFSNFAWTAPNGRDTLLTLEQEETLSHWNTEPGGIFLCLTVFILSNFVLSALAVTMPIPNGIFVPSFLMGAAFGRMVGEFFHYWFPQGIGGVDIRPGCYALVGSAAMSGSVTRTISTSVIVFELTGQIAHSLPVLIAVILANMVAQCLQPSMYDSIIQMKQLPFLPDIVSATKDFYDITAEHIMQTRLSYICWKQPYKEVYSIIRNLNKNEVVPLVESHESMVLLGTVRVAVLQAKISQHISKAALLKFISNWKNQTFFSEVYSIIRNLNKNEVVPLVESHESMVLLGTVRVAVLQAKISQHISKAALLKFISNGSDFHALKTRTQHRSRKNLRNRKYKSSTDIGTSVPLSEQCAAKSSESVTGDSSYMNERRRQSMALFSTDFQSFIDQNPAAMKKAKVRPLANLFSGSIADMSTASTLVQDHGALAAAYHQTKRSSLTGMASSAYDNNATSMSSNMNNSTAATTITRDDILEWEELRMKLPIRFDFNEIDESPFCIVTLTSLPKIHSLFSLLGLNKVYVTRMGTYIHSFYSTFTVS